MLVEFAAAHTRSSAVRSPMPVAGESIRTSSFWVEVKYSVEKSICASRSQLMVNVSTTMSTSGCSSASTADPLAVGDGDELDRVGAPNRARAISRAMSTSKPSNSPVKGLTLEKRRVDVSTPTRSRPRARISAM